MYHINICGDGPISHIMVRLCRRSGFSHIGHQAYSDEGANTAPPALTLGANQTRILYALGLAPALQELAWPPDREQVRLARSQYLISELPLGKFYQDRYGAPMLNLSYHELLNTVMTEVSTPHFNDSELTIATEESALSNSSDLTHATQPTALRLLYGHFPSTHSIANVTWLARNAIAWQFSTQTKDHIYLLSQSAVTLQSDDWHPSLWAQIEQLQPVDALKMDNGVRNHWVEGDLVHLGHATMGCHPMRRETWFTGIEDAWVLSRMLENYEEAISEGLQAYQQYRKPRAERIHRSNQALLNSQLAITPTARLLRNVGIGLRSRFLPEIAMQRIDWLYGYDCIKGFN